MSDFTEDRTNESESTDDKAAPVGAVKSSSTIPIMKSPISEVLSKMTTWSLSIRELPESAPNVQFADRAIDFSDWQGEVAAVLTAVMAFVDNCKGEKKTVVAPKEINDFFKTLTGHFESRMEDEPKIRKKAADSEDNENTFKISSNEGSI